MTVNENQIPIYVLQPEISGQIKQTTLEEIKNWIKDGELLPHHQVRIKNLSWVEAQNIPVFQSLFESKKNAQTEQSNHFYSQSLPAAAVSEKTSSEIKKAAALSKETPLSNANVREESKTVEPSAVFKAYEKKALAKSKPFEQKIEPARQLPRPSKKSLIVKQTAGFLAGCLLAFLISFGGSYLWIYQLKTPVAIDEKSVPGLANLDNKLTADKLDLRFKKAEQEQKSKDAGQIANPPQQTDISQQLAQLEKQFDAQRKTVIENHRNKLQDTDFTATFSFSFAVSLALFLLVRIFYGKTSQPAKHHYSSHSPALQPVEPLAIPPTDVADINVENSQDKQESAEANDIESAETHPIEPPDKAENPAEIIDVAEDAGAAESPKISNCLLHQNKSSIFVCESCGSNFCDVCVKTFDEVENCCPLCKTACKSLEANINEAAAPNSATKEKKKTNLLDLGKDSNFIVYDYPDERTRKLGIIPAFLIALLFSVSISIFWVYKISPLLENRNKETSQNISPNAEQNSDRTANKSVETANAPIGNTGIAAPADEPCIDPETKQPFECNEETRKALFEHTRKVKSVEDAQKAVTEKTSVISGLTSENANRESPKPNAAEEMRKAVEKQQLIKSFSISFVGIFGLLLLSRFFSKGKNS